MGDQSKQRQPGVSHINITTPDGAQIQGTAATEPFGITSQTLMLALDKLKSDLRADLHTDAKKDKRDLSKEIKDTRNELLEQQQPMKEQLAARILPLVESEASELEAMEDSEVQEEQDPGEGGSGTQLTGIAWGEVAVKRRKKAQPSRSYAATAAKKPKPDIDWKRTIPQEKRSPRLVITGNSDLKEFNRAMRTERLSSNRCPLA